MKIILSISSAVLILSGCAGLPQGKSKIKSENGSSFGINYLTREELINHINKKTKDETDRAIELKMVPSGGKIVLSKSPNTKDRRLTYMVIKQNGNELKTCDDKSEKELSSYRGQNMLGEVYSNEYSFECGLNMSVEGEFEVELLDTNKELMKKIIITP